MKRKGRIHLSMDTVFWFVFFLMNDFEFIKT